MRAAMKPLPTLMKPLASVDLATGEPAQALVERSDVAAVEALAVVAEAAVAFELARAAREKFGGDALGDFVAAHARVPRAHRLAPRADRHLALVGFMGAGKTTLGAEVARRLGRPFVDLDREIERRRAHDRRDLRAQGEAAFRELEARRRARRAPGAASRASSRSAAARSTTPSVRDGAARARVHRLLDVDVDTAWERVGGSDRPLAQDEAEFRALLRRAARRSTREVADARRRATPTTSCSPPPASTSSSARSTGSASSSPATAPVALVADAHVAGIHGMDAQLALGARLASTHELPPGEEAKTARRCSSGSGRSSASTAAARSSRSAAAHDRRRRLRRGDVPARHRLGAGADDARRPGRRGDRRQDGDRPARRARTSSAPSTGPRAR